MAAGMTNTRTLARRRTVDDIRERDQNPRDELSKGARIRHVELLNANHRYAKHMIMSGQWPQNIDYGCHLIRGPKGNGKSLLAAFLTAMFYKAGREVFSTIGLDFGWQITSMDFYMLSLRAPPNCVIVVDEFHTVLNRQFAGALRNIEAVKACAAFRKNNVTLIAISQQAQNIDHSFQSECVYFWYPEIAYPGKDKALSLIHI